ncbi:transcription regulator HTH, apses-type DNA-binding domain-containing protein [Gongronella butleri]|nr:transcription regulator HTH, apses-type DNA-binding domain-containing protein [Gongronella butleri]
MQRPKLTTTVWEDENTVCYQVDAKSVCVARRQDNDMINGTKLLNVVGMSRGKRDGILKNEKGRVVVKVGAMHLKGVWITFERAKDLAAKFKIEDLLYPLFTDDPSIYLCPSTIPGTNMPSSTLLPPSTSGSAHANHLTTMVVPSRIPPSLPYKHDPYAFSMPTWDRPTSDTHETLDHQDSFTSKATTKKIGRTRLIMRFFLFSRYFAWQSFGKRRPAEWQLQPSPWDHCALDAASHKHNSSAHDVWHCNIDHCAHIGACT